MTVSVQLTDEMVADARAMAAETHRPFANSPGYYNDNRFARHFRGKLGEVACEQWAISAGIPCEPIFRDNNRMQAADLHFGGLNSHRIEVKTWNVKHWQNLGRCVSVKQMPGIRAKADAVIWCVTPDSIASVTTVEIVGWNTVAEIAQMPRVLTRAGSGRPVCNHQVPVEQVRPLEELVNCLQTPSP